MSVFIIAEAGVNHNGDILLAKRLIDIAVEAKVDAVKFQTFSADLSISQSTQKADYQKNSLTDKESQYDMVKKLELSYDEFYELKQYCDSKGIVFLSTPDEIESAYMLNNLQDIFKIGSGEVTNLPLLRYIGGLKKKIIFSTGMATLEEIEAELAILVKAGTPKEMITILHTHTQYPTQMHDVNLNIMNTLKEKFQVDIGYSDHTLGIEVAIAAVAMGATIIEKHFTIDKEMSGPDHKASLSPEELILMVQSIRNIEKAMGDGIKKPTRNELQNLNVCRKSIVANSAIEKGDVFSQKNLTIKKPGNGISPMLWDSIIGTKSKKNYKKDELI